MNQHLIATFSVVDNTAFFLLVNHVQFLLDYQFITYQNSVTN